MSYATYEWYLKADLRQYAGQWVAIADKSVVAFGSSAAEVIRAAKKAYPRLTPFVTKIKTHYSIL